MASIETSIGEFFNEKSNDIVRKLMSDVGRKLDFELESICQEKDKLIKLKLQLENENQVLEKEKKSVKIASEQVNKIKEQTLTVQNEFRKTQAEAAKKDAEIEERARKVEKLEEQCNIRKTEIKHKEEKLKRAQEDLYAEQDDLKRHQENLRGRENQLEKKLDDVTERERLLEQKMKESVEGERRLSDERQQLELLKKDIEDREAGLAFREEELKRYSKKSAPWVTLQEFLHNNSEEISSGDAQRFKKFASVFEKTGPVYVKVDSLMEVKVGVKVGGEWSNEMSPIASGSGPNLTLTIQKLCRELLSLITGNTTIGAGRLSVASYQVQG